MVYLVGHEEEEIKGNRKISLFDESRFEDITIDHQLNDSN